MKANVMISIQPWWCYKIFNGTKIIEVRKTEPSSLYTQAPFKCYIYCTKPKLKRTEGAFTFFRDSLYRIADTGEVQYGDSSELWKGGKGKKDNYLCEKVIGEFTCKCIQKYIRYGNKSKYIGSFDELTIPASLNINDLAKYAGEKGVLYGWEITGVKLYDKPLSIKDFANFRTGEHLTKPPVSWGYVRDLK